MFQTFSSSPDKLWVVLVRFIIEQANMMLSRFVDQKRRESIETLWFDRGQIYSKKYFFMNNQLHSDWKI